MNNYPEDKKKHVILQKAIHACPHCGRNSLVEVETLLSHDDESVYKQALENCKICRGKPSK